MKLALSSQILKVETKPDKTLLIKINTQEVSPEEAAWLFNKNMEQVYIVFLDENEINNDIYKEGEYH